MKKVRMLMAVYFSLFFGCIHANAQSKASGIIVELKNGEKVEIRLVDKPILIFDGNKISLTAKEVAMEYAPEEIEKVTMCNSENESNSIEELNAKQSNIQLSSGYIRLNNFKAGEPVKIYSVSGMLLLASEVELDGTLVISVSELPSGISIIKTNKQSIKIIR